MESSPPPGRFFSLLEASARYAAFSFCEISAVSLHYSLTFLPPLHGGHSELTCPGRSLRYAQSPGFLGLLLSRTKATVLSIIPLLPVFMSFPHPHPSEKAPEEFSERGIQNPLATTFCWPNSPNSTTRGSIRLAEQRGLGCCHALCCREGGLDRPLPEGGAAAREH